MGLIAEQMRLQEVKRKNNYDYAQGKGSYPESEISTTPDCTDSTKKISGRKILVLSGVAQRERRHSSFQLDALVVVKINIVVNQRSGIDKGVRTFYWTKRPNPLISIVECGHSLL